MKTVWIIDGAYLFTFGKTTPFDYLKLKQELERVNDGPLYEGYYLNSTANPTTDTHSAFYTWLKSAAPKGPKLRVQLYQFKNVHSTCPTCTKQFERPVQKGVDVGIATLLIKLAVQNVYDRLILSAGDGDFEDAISYVKSDLHKEVWLNGSQGTLSADLQSYADHVLWLEDLLPAIGK